MPLPDAKYFLYVNAAFYLLMAPLHVLMPDPLLQAFLHRPADDALLKHIVGVQGISMLFIGLTLFDAAFCGSAAGQKVVSRMSLLMQLINVAHEYNTGMNVDAKPMYITFTVLLSCSLLGMLSASQAATKTKKKK